MATPHTTHGSYPAGLLPRVSKRKADKKTWCLRFAKMLDHFDEHPHLWTQQGLALARSQSPLLRLPPEIRQEILHQVMDDQTLCEARPNKQTRALAQVCRTFADDLEQTMKQWDKDEAALRASFGTERQAMSAYIQDLMAPISLAASALPRMSRSYNSSNVDKKTRMNLAMADR